MESSIDDLHNWMDSYAISYQKRHIAKDFSDAMPLAKILKHHFPKSVNFQQYGPKHSISQKIENWNTLNKRVLCKLNIYLQPQTIEELAKSTPGTIEKILLDVKTKLQKKEKRSRETLDEGCSWQDIGIEPIKAEAEENAKRSGERMLELEINKIMKDIENKDHEVIAKNNKDQCPLCVRYNGATTEQEGTLQSTYEEHKQHEADANNSKICDKERASADSSFVTVTFDLQSVLQIPCSDVSPMYYSRKLCGYNLTNYEGAAPNNANCFAWTEKNVDTQNNTEDIGENGNKTHSASELHTYHLCEDDDIRSEVLSEPLTLYESVQPQMQSSVRRKKLSEDRVTIGSRRGVPKSATTDFDSYESAFDIFGRSVAAQLKTLPKRTALTTQLKLQTILIQEQIRYEDSKLHLFT
ncbi:spermatogenesis-associated 4-related [Holotrichia oblita]|uniref:Spermatogenesis-associated 4-related n=1 Tax=Holotrichia oblita TaxID=644536 RepID=A0ACB9TMS8_HOLOL|nr:spermatogenesis-associated 4-related [Holotrichia oblita]